jgi:hypothetical protein
VQRLEQVRLADAVRTDREHEAGLQAQLEPRIRPERRKLKLRDDQVVLANPAGGSA